MPETHTAPTQGGVDFSTFIVLWNRAQGQSTPALHRRMALWLEDSWTHTRTRLLLQAFRAAGKSTIVGLFAAWLLYRNPDLRILVLAADTALATKMVRQVKKILERHPATTALKPQIPDQWAGERFTVARALNLRDPSMLARGVLSNVTGSRADIIICDDVEVPNTANTPHKRTALRERLAESTYTLAPGGTVLYAGTPHSYYSIYADTPRPEAGETSAFLDGYERLTLPILTDTGESAWPEKFPLAAMDELRARTGPNKFASQMLLRPVNIAEGRLDVSLIRPYRDELVLVREIAALYLGDTRLVSGSAWWDPAFGTERGDGSAFAVVFSDASGHLYLHRVVYFQNRNADPATDIATWQCREVARLARALHIPAVTIETNGIGAFLPGLLRNVLAENHTACVVREHAQTKPKDLRILETFDVLLAARRLHAHDSVLAGPFGAEMREWRPGAQRGRDDALDAAAGALAQERLVMPPAPPSGHQSWTRGARTYKAGSDFDV